VCERAYALSIKVYSFVEEFGGSTAIILNEFELRLLVHGASDIIPVNHI
jgi:hypothetical protein